MTLIFCVDDNFGLMFNKRRQSRDSAVIEDIINNYEKLYVSPYSEKLFRESNANYEVCEDFMNCDDTCVCFVEDKYTPEMLKIADVVILYHWGKAYPSDIKLDYQLLAADFTLSDSSQFVGTSHKEIKKERYTR